MFVTCPCYFQSVMLDEGWSSFYFTKKRKGGIVEVPRHEVDYGIMNLYIAFLVTSSIRTNALVLFIDAAFELASADTELSPSLDVLHNHHFRPKFSFPKHITPSICRQTLTKPPQAPPPSLASLATPTSPVCHSSGNGKTSSSGARVDTSTARDSSGFCC